MAKVAFLGLGVMGGPMARHLAKKGHEVTVYNRTTAKAEAWVAEPTAGAFAATPREAAAKGQEIVFACVGNDDDLRSVTLGADGAFAGMEKGAVFVDHTTASAEVARELLAEAADAELGLAFIDAPVSGGQAGAENAALTVMCGGDTEAIYAKRRTRDPVLSPSASTADGPVGLRPAHQDGQPDLPSRASSRACRRRCTSPSAPGLDVECGAGGDLQGGCRFLADGEPGQDHESPRSSTSASRWTGCARIWASCSLEARRNGAQAARSPRWSTSSTPTCRPWAATAGTPPSLIARLEK